MSVISSPRISPDPGIKPESSESLALGGRVFATVPPGKGVGVGKRKRRRRKEDDSEGGEGRERKMVRGKGRKKSGKI